MKKTLIAITTIFLLGTTLTLNSCKKTCADCPEGTTLSVDEPKEKMCICCPTGETYNEVKGYCE